MKEYLVLDHLGICLELFPTRFLLRNASYIYLNDVHKQLPRLLLISPFLLHPRKVYFSIRPRHLPFLLERLDKRLSDSLRHFTRRATNIYHTTFLCERFEYQSRLLPYQILDVDFLSLWSSLAS